jgi:hypothetical protein
MVGTPNDFVQNLQIQTKVKKQNPMKGRRFTPVPHHNTATARNVAREILKQQAKIMMNSTF